MILDYTTTTTSVEENSSAFSLIRMFGGRDSPSIVLDDLWKHIFLATEAPSDSFDL